MSIAVLNQVYDEARRLAVAGSVVARGDFRLKKLLPPLDQAGAKAPVFAKVAECARAVIDGSEETSAESLLELTSLVTAVLYTQGETGVAGPLEPIESVDMGGAAAQTSARLLKPLLEALSSTGSGRLELVRDAHQRGAFRDLRLVKPALNGLDDPYSEIADFLAEKVLPLYGPAILPELRAKYDPKGTKGHPHRLKLMHAIDPAGSRDLVKHALDNGSPEVRVTAIQCLGGSADDLPYLIEQASSRNRAVRDAAYGVLAAFDTPAVLAVFAKAIGFPDVRGVAAAIFLGKNPKLADLHLAETRKEIDALVALKDKKAVSTKVQRLVQLIEYLPVGTHPAADALTIDLFARRGQLDKVKGADLSGSDVSAAVIRRMVSGPAALQTALARAHAELDADDLPVAVAAARQTLPAAEVYDLFAPYLTAKVDEKKKGKDAPAAKREAVINALGGGNVYWRVYQDDGPPPLDPRWLDLAVKVKHLGLVNAVGRTGHRAAEAFLQAEFDAAFAKAKSPDPLRDVVIVMVRLSHPKAAEALIASFEKTIGKANAYTHWYHYLIPDLPKSAVPLLEAVVPKLKDREADLWLEAIQELRDKT